MCGYKLSVYLDQIFSQTVLMPFYWFTMKVCGRDTYFGLTYEEIMMQNMDSSGVMAGAA